MYVLIFNGLKERMMKTKEEILNEFGCPDIPFDENVTMYYPAILSAMEEYAQQQLKILNIPAVSGSSSPDDFWKQEYDEAVKEIGNLQDQLKDAESAIRDMESELRSRY